MEVILKQLLRHKWFQSLTRKKRNHLIFFIILIALAIAVLLYSISEKQDVRLLRSESSFDTMEQASTVETPSNAAISEALIYVDVTGAVQKSMVIELKAGSRVFDAIEAAGGLRDDACIRDLNRATILRDGDRIYIPTNDEVNDGTVPASESTGNANSDGKININSANESTLQQINGVGPSTAGKIMEYRQQNGSFSCIEDIQNVKGIGVKTFENMKDQICV
ncbi:MAG: helix-hairpin-helix domain-containing protein [Clostridiales Family XIII bacterium]|jgi:competence protein ComEA|nr:helix-hairpin-helix domain-containing protein [Clostridiales Family XIII bacterium]